MTAPGSIIKKARSSRDGAFTLVEVVVATGMLAVTVVAAVALQAAILRSASDVADLNRAVSLVDAIRVELTRVRDRAGRQAGADGLSALAELIASGGDRGLSLVASRDGSRVVVEADADDQVRGVPPRDRFYLVEVRPQSAQLTYRSEAGFLSLSCQIRWPYRLPIDSNPDASVTAQRDQASCAMFNLALTP